MQVFQVIVTVLFLVSLALAYGANLLKLINKLSGKTSGPVVQPSIAISLVDDIRSVTQLRDRLAAEGCEEGVDACTVLLRVIVEYQEPSKGVV
jgi:hypothetical protein